MGAMGVVMSEQDVLRVYEYACSMRGPGCFLVQALPCRDDSGTLMMFNNFTCAGPRAWPSILDYSTCQYPSPAPVHRMINPHDPDRVDYLLEGMHQDS